MIDRHHALDAIRNSDVADLEVELIELLAPSIRIGVRRVVGNDVPLGVSRFGGMPDLPSGVAWPHSAGRPMAHIAQLRLDELAPFDELRRLPEHGHLAFFFDTENASPFADVADASRPWHVEYFECPLGQLQRTEPPRGETASRAFPYFALAFESELTLPSYESAVLESVPLDEARRRAYEELVFSLHSRPPVPTDQHARPWTRVWRQIEHMSIGDPIHRVLGHPEHFQADPRVDWQRLSEHRRLVIDPDRATRTEARHWQLLLQMDTYRDGPDWLWGGAGTFYFGIHEDDLARADFENVQWTVECV